jgi:UDP-N-acetylglucosamine acyltransferase
MSIHSTAIIAEGAEIHNSAEIGPYAVIGPNVVIGADTKIGAHTIIDGHTEIGKNCHIFASASVGLEPQDLGYKGEPTGVKIGDRVTIREFVTIHRAAKEGYTIIGDDCFLMNYVHISHNSKLGKSVILANGCMMAGHVTIGDGTVSSGLVIFHQHVRVGRGVMLSGLTGTRVDLPPFSTCDSRPAKVRGVNVIGMRRNKIGPTQRTAIKQAYKLLYRSGLNISQAIDRIKEEVPSCNEITELIDFIESSTRGVAGAAQPDAVDFTEIAENAVL